MDLVSISYVALWIIVITQGIALVLVFRSVGTVFLASREGIYRDGLQIGTKAPLFRAYEHGEERSLGDYVGKWLVLVFAAPACQICLNLIPGLEILREDLGKEAEVLILLRAGDEVAADYRQITNTTMPVLAIGQRGVAEQWLVRVSPFAHILDPSGVIKAKGLVNTVENVTHLLYEAGMRHDRVGEHTHGVEASHAS